MANKVILVIDDEKDIRDIIREMLEAENYSVLDAGNGNEGIKLFKENSVDYVITDLVMPEKDGFEVINELREKQPDIRVMATSAHVTTEEFDYLCLAKKLGATVILHKPFSREDLLSALDALVG
jgi:two-component system chemotaxis response regulator CheY